MYRPRKYASTQQQVSHVVRFVSTPARYTNGTCAATGANSTLQCPLNYASGVAEAFGPLDVPLSDTACSSETLDAASWKIEVRLSMCAVGRLFLTTHHAPACFSPVNAVPGCSRSHYSFGRGFAEKLVGLVSLRVALVLEHR